MPVKRFNDPAFAAEGAVGAAGRNPAEGARDRHNVHSGGCVAANIVAPDAVREVLASLVPIEVRSINVTYVHGSVGSGKTFFIERSLNPR